MGNVKVLERSCRMGLASAVVDGLRLAESNVIAVIDADLQHPPELLPRMLEKINEGHDIVVASRYIEGGSIEGWSPLRRIISKGAVKLAQLLLPSLRTLRDPVSGYFMFKREVFEGMKVLKPSGFKILLEVLARGKYSSVAEIPYTFRSRVKGKSKLILKEIIGYTLFLLKARVRS
jgi:dolichol-phosphate mannosyltransferase